MTRCWPAKSRNPNSLPAIPPPPGRPPTASKRSVPLSISIWPFGVMPVTSHTHDRSKRRCQRVHGFFADMPSSMQLFTLRLNSTLPFVLMPNRTQPFVLMSNRTRLFTSMPKTTTASALATQTHLEHEIYNLDIKPGKGGEGEREGR